MPQLNHPHVRKLPCRLTPWTAKVQAAALALSLALSLAPAALASPLDKVKPAGQAEQAGQTSQLDQAEQAEQAEQAGQPGPLPEALQAAGELNSTTAARHSFVDRRNVQKLIDSVSSTSRETSKNAREISSTLKTVLDLRLPLIDEKCDVNVSHELLRLGYAYYARTPGAEAELRGAADALVRKKDGEYRGVTALCRAALKGFGVAVLRVYLGSEWTADDDSRFERPSSREQRPAAETPEKAAPGPSAAPGEGPGPAKSGN